ncbi:ribonuclease III, partial [Aureobasidium melanogenum]
MKRIATQHMRRSLLSPRALRLLSPASPASPLASSRRCFALSTRRAQDAPVTRLSATLPEAAVDQTSADLPVASETVRVSVKASRRDSPKLSALHARLSLPPRFPKETLGRCLVHPSADRNPLHNNASLAVIGQDLLAYYTAEWLLCNYPRLPTAVLFAAQYAYSGPRTLSAMREEWGVESVAAPGTEVDPGLLQYLRQKPGNAMAEGAMLRLKDMPSADTNSASARPNSQWNYRRGLSSRIVYDNQFGDLHDNPTSSASGSSQSPDGAVTTEEASASFINAVFGALYLHAGAQ